MTVRWIAFSFGPPLLEALRLGSIDFGTAGDTPPIFAQAARPDLLYVAAPPSAGSGSAIPPPRQSRESCLTGCSPGRSLLRPASYCQRWTLPLVVGRNGRAGINIRLVSVHMRRVSCSA